MWWKADFINVYITKTLACRFFAGSHLSNLLFAISCIRFLFRQASEGQGGQHFSWIGRVNITRWLLFVTLRRSKALQSAGYISCWLRWFPFDENHNLSFSLNNLVLNEYSFDRVWQLRNSTSAPFGRYKVDDMMQFRFLLLGFISSSSWPFIA